MLPGSYERWFVEICGRAAPVEARSTCDSCAMLPGAPDLPPSGAFDADVRCCTYHPHLAPHFVGGILKDGSASAAAIVRARIAGRTGVTPLGLGPSPEYGAARERVMDPRDAFGHAHELLCPFYDGGRCGIWHFRGVPCAAFHCKFDRGAVGFGLWNLITIAFNTIERALGEWLLRRFRLHVPACDALLHAPADDALYKRAWGAFWGREEEYFLEAARLVEPLSWTDVASLGGDDLVRLAAALRDAVARADGPLPERVRRGEGVLVQLGRPGTVRLQNPGIPFDLLDIPAEVAARLEQVQPARLTELGLDERLVRQLIDWQALIPQP